MTKSELVDTTGEPVAVWPAGQESAGALVVYPSVKITEGRRRSTRYLSEHERIEIADLLAAETSVRGIAEQLGRSPSTISREICRNSGPDSRYRRGEADDRVRAGHWEGDLNHGRQEPLGDRHDLGAHHPPSCDRAPSM
jgi:hypothetical protein